MVGISGSTLSTTAEHLETVGDASLGIVGSGSVSPVLLGCEMGAMQELSGGHSAALDTGSEQSFADGAPIDAERLGQSILGLAAFVAPDKIIGINRYAFAGHVYDLDARVGWYVANGIIVHNCLCDFVPQYGDVSDTTAGSGDTGDEGE
jgi:hypothetical protein